MLEAALLLLALGAAASLRPWRALRGAGPPWPWLATLAVMPLLWSLDRRLPGPLAVSMSLAPLLTLMAGWPLAVLAMAALALALAAGGVLPPAEALQRLVWFGLAPASLLLGWGAALRRWLPPNLFVYILGRGFFGTLAACTLAGAASVLLHGARGGSGQDDALLGHLLAGFGEATLTGMLTAILVAFRPQWLATWSDRLYLPPPPR